MICSVSTGKSRSSWLDRLRTAKGFPENGVTDLEMFLQNPSSPIAERPGSVANSDPICCSTRDEDKQFFNIMSDVLNELFNFGDKCGNSTKLKTSARKQINPRICVFSNNGSREINNAAAEKPTLLRSGDSNSGVEGVRELDKWENDGEGVERDGNLTGFSRTEVMVIDTSYESWKFEKLLYRKKNVWKVRDKKGKSVIMRSKKKRKVSRSVEEDQHGGKKLKVDKKEGSTEGCELPLNEVYHQINKSEVLGKGSSKVGGTLEKKQEDLKSGNGSSSVILIKSIHTGRKNGLKSKQKKT
ncbi:uncharacterized protein LOC105166784 [Sesamum indicum]|uniref:Uncharacterized protein LOC105166784 n=1 Tax=Sesamum indicum TaxID=4182 RepID=A0A6I9TMP1_SESIN|nr:uncharacterized protein LOC105166784 [Sesamum indicum]